MNLVILVLAIPSLLAFPTSSALTLLGICTQPGFIRSSHRNRFDWHSTPHFRKFVKEQPEPEEEEVLHDAENVFHLLKKLPNDCFTYVSLKIRVFIILLLIIIYRTSNPIQLNVAR